MEIPLVDLPGVNVGDVVSVQILGVNGDNAVVKVVPGNNPINDVQAKTMPLGDLKSFLQNQAATRAYENPAAKIAPKQ